MTTISIKIPEDKQADLSSFVKKIGGEVIADNKKPTSAETEEDEVTHESFFGENIKRVIRAFKA